MYILFSENNKHGRFSGPCHGMWLHVILDAHLSTKLYGDTS